MFVSILVFSFHFGAALLLISWESRFLFLRRVVFADNNSCTDLWSLHARLTIYALVISPSSVCPAKSGLTVQTLGAKQELAYPL